ncbi:MAG: c-type cytochrome domain-containing protein [Candidatus Competibacter denitrificans]|jgi:hypothetical protein
MNSRKLLTSALILGLGVLVGCSGEQPDKLVSFQKDVLPVLKASCAECHTPPKGEGYQKTGLSVATYDDVMKGTKLGKVIIPGQSLNSSLNRLIEGRPGVDPSIQMPHGKVKLPEAQLIVLRKWVDQGAKNN